MWRDLRGTRGAAPVRWTAILVLVALVAPGCSRYRAVRARSRVPHIVLVSLDTLHVNWTGPYNPDVTTTPFLDRFAESGVRFDRAYTHTPITLPSHASLMTGLAPPDAGVMANGDRLPESTETLAEILRAAGYRTAAFTSLGVLQATFGLSQGFEHYEDLFAQGPIRWYRRANEVFPAVESWLASNHDEPFFLWVHLSDPHEPYVPVDAPPDAELWLDHRLLGRYNLASAEQFPVTFELPPGEHRLRFVSLRRPRPDDRPETGLEVLLVTPDVLRPYADGALPDASTHVPLRPDLEIDLTNPESEKVALEILFAGQLARPTPGDVLPGYEAEVAFADRYVGKIDALLETYGIRDDTLFAIVSDHGEGLFAHTVLGHASHVYEDQLRILWMMRGPSLGIPSGRVVEERVGLISDVAPTILDLLGLPSRGMAGSSLVGCWDDERPCPPTPTFWSYGLFHETRGLTGMAAYEWPYKWMWRRGFKRIAFDVSKDPWETVNLLDHPGPHNPEPLKRAAEHFREERRRLSKALEKTRRESPNEEHEKLLKSLGYIGNAREP